MFKLDPLHQLSTTTVNGLTNVVTELHWLYESTVNEKLYKVHGPKIALTAPDAESFVDFDDLTEDQVNAWIVATLPSDQQQWYIDRIAESEECHAETHARWVSDRDAWEAEQQEKIDNGEIEEALPFPDIEPSGGTVLDMFCVAPETTEQAFPWA